MEHLVKIDSIKRRNSSEATNWNEEIIVKEENIELEIDPLSICDEGIETDYESEERYPYIDYTNWYKSSIADLSKGLRLFRKFEKEESFFNSNHLGDLAEQCFVCFYCGELWNDRNGLKFHIKDIHMAEQSIKPTNRAFECFYCKRKFANIDRLVSHTRRKHKQKYKEKKRKEKNRKVEEKPFACQHCKFRAKARCLLNSHVQRVHEKIKPFQCPYCEFKSAYNHGIRYHIGSKHEHRIMSEHEIVKPAVHDVCGDRLVQTQNLRFQMKLKHEDRKPYACPKCDYRATRDNILKNHIRSKHDKVCYYCPYCDFKTIFEKSLSIHISVKHQKLKQCACPYCDFRAEHFQHIKVHIKNEHEKDETDIKIHEKEKTYSCFLCEVQFSQSADLSYHLKTFHEKKKLYSCSHCNYNCFKVSDLKSHTASVHGTVSTLYSCAHCDFLSYNLEELKSHATTEHGKVELFSCPHCEFRCVRKEMFDSHISLQHKSI